MGRRVALITGVTGQDGAYVGSPALERLAQFCFNPAPPWV